MKPRPIWAGLIVVALALASCAPWQAQYLKQAANQGTMEEVEDRLGRPHSTWDLRTGETLWAYQAGVPSGADAGGVTIVGPGWVVGRRSGCTEYVLLFDGQKILRAWMRQPCKSDRPVIGDSGRGAFGPVPACLRCGGADDGQNIALSPTVRFLTHISSSRQLAPQPL